MINKLKKIFNIRLNRSIERKDIMQSEIKSLMSKGAILIDVRSPQEYNEGHLDNSILLPEYEILKKIEDIIPNKNTKIILYCSSGTRSKKAQEELEKMGYVKAIDKKKCEYTGKTVAVYERTQAGFETVNYEHIPRID